jgi:small nuclear ribonucleoprotein G
MASKQGYGPDLKKYMDKHLDIKLNAGRRVIGVLRGFDQFMNLVLEESVEVVGKDEKNPIGTVMIRGNSVVLWECLDKIN